MEGAEFALMCLFIGCFVLGWFLPAKKKREVEWPFEIVVREKRVEQPKVIVKEVIRYVERPAKSPPKSMVRPPPKPPTTASNPSIIKKGSGTPTIKTVKPQVNQAVFNEAKNGLVSLGYGAGEAKRILESIGGCSTAEEYIRKAMMRTKK